MILLRLFFLILMVFVLVTLALSALVWLKLRLHLQNPFLKEERKRHSMRDEKTIEGEYQVLDDTRRDS